MQTCTPEWRKSFLKDNASTFKNVSIEIGVIRMQGKATETRKTVILIKKKKKKKHYQITFEKKKF